ncbi:MAG: adenosine deaminase [bacterium]|nr:adenosine deaminase [bacterium]
MQGEIARRLPKAVLHDHLDGGLRVESMIELAASCGYNDLPSNDPTGLADAMHQGQSGSLTRYLASFSHTVAVMQTREAIERVAYECGIDHHEDGVVYAEVRFGPSLLTEGDLTREDAIEAVLTGINRASAKTGLQFGIIISALRQQTDSADVARAAARYCGHGVVGFDLAGSELGNPPEDHLPAIRLAREAGLGITLHAGEAAGPTSIASALGRGGAQRIGHGVRIIDDCVVEGDTITELGPLAARIRDYRIPLEVAPTSNIHTGMATDAASHPFGLLHRAGFNVSINTDNRLMSGVTMSSEMALVKDTFGLSIAELAAITVHTLEAGFGDWPTRHQLIEHAVKPAYAAAS